MSTHSIAFLHWNTFTTNILPTLSKHLRTMPKPPWPSRPVLAWSTLKLPKVSGTGSTWGSRALGPEPLSPEPLSPEPWCFDPLHAEPLYSEPSSDCCWSLAAFFFKGTPQVTKACLWWWYCKQLCSLYLRFSCSDSFLHWAPKRFMSAADSARLEPFLIRQCCLTKSAKGLQAFGAKPSNKAALRARFGFLMWPMAKKKQVLNCLMIPEPWAKCPVPLKQLATWPMLFNKKQIKPKLQNLRAMICICFATMWVSTVLLPKHFCFLRSKKAICVKHSWL